MLIPSRRHTMRDLAIWEVLEEADRVHGAQPSLATRVRQSTEAIRVFLAGGAAYISTSWGKDSVTLADLCLRVAPTAPLVHLKAIPTGNPESGRVRDAFLERHPGAVYHEREVNYRGIPRGLGPDEVEREKDRLFFAAFREFGDRHISGIRASESGGRKIRMRRWGLASHHALAPLGWWTDRDVFGYLAANGLPVHPSYAMLGGGRWDRRHIRVDELGGARGDQFGRAEWELEYYGDVLRRLAVAARS